MASAIVSDDAISLLKKKSIWVSQSSAESGQP